MRPKVLGMNVHDGIYIEAQYLNDLNRAVRKGLTLWTLFLMKSRLVFLHLRHFQSLKYQR